MEKVEILAPAGNMECFMAAMNAGADAVYMAGKSFGARASADNFTEEEFIWALRYAHIHGRKIYLTLNTLIKEREWNKIYSFLKPLYEEGLDGVIIQDYGLIDYLSLCFPKLELHASTQMTITDYRSARLLKSKGICRVVPARELSLEEIKELKEKTGLDIETFVHGALCYSYSGQCLFSSFLGGRSGNRGRCAGPCRLPYSVSTANGFASSKEQYPISLKDLCTIEHVGELIEAGINSFKIEGRMKSAEYVAGVTAIYRKYVDAYYDGLAVKVSDTDKKILSNLYLRTSLGTGYYYKHNDAAMISISDPSYNNQDPEIVKRVHDSYSQVKLLKKISCEAILRLNSPMRLTVFDNNGISITVSGETVELASSHPAQSEDIIKRLSKTGGTNYTFDDINLILDDNCFISVKQLNELRRSAIEQYELKLIDSFRRTANENIIADSEFKNSTEDIIGVSILLPQTFEYIKDYDIDKLYIPYDLIYSHAIDTDMLSEYIASHDRCSIYITLPRIIRKRDHRYLEALRIFLKEHCEKNQKSIINGVLVRNLEEVEFLKESAPNVHCELDYTLYGWNKESAKFLGEYSDSITAPIELSLHELNDLEDRNLIIPIYGYAPLMVSAGCLAKTYNNCSKKRYGFDYELKDRYKKTENVFINCIHCYNEIYNSVPTSLHKRFDDLKNYGYSRFRIDFTIENRSECRRVLDYYLKDKKGNVPVCEFTTGHIEKGAL